ncbi:MAG TPA: YceD family protein [Verrucomicrobiae bacterium]|nr:YceD family protein [Verrucomicrobiae bacterium]
MSLKVNLRHLEEHELHLQGELPVEELELDVHDEIIRAEKPLHYDLQVEKLHQAILVQGKLEILLDCDCVRCLKSFEHRLELPRWALHLPLEGEEKVSVDNDCVDLTPFVREDILLEFPQHPLCKSDCNGLSAGEKSKARGRQDLKTSAWAELNKLKL